MYERMKRLILISGLVIPCVAPVHAESVVFRLTAPPYHIDQGRIAMEGFGTLAVAGAPRLPSKIFHLALSAPASVNDVSFRSLHRETLQGKYEIDAVNPLLPMAAGDASPPSIDEFENQRSRFFGTDRPYPENPAVFLGVDSDGGNTVVKIQYSPFQYNPVQKSLCFVGDIEVTIQYAVNGPAAGSPGQTPVWIDAVGGSAGNRLSKPSATAVGTSLLVVTSESLKKILEPFLFWKRCLGDSVRFVPTESIYAMVDGSDRADKIRNFLRTEFVNSGITDVLLVGHKDFLPVKKFFPDPKNHKESGGVPSDFYFSELTGDWDTDHDGFPGEFGEDEMDWIPEIRVARIPWSDSTVVRAILERTIAYEKSQGAWKATPLLAGGISNYRNENGNSIYAEKTDGATLMEWLRRNAFTEPPSFTLYEKEGSAPSSFDCSLPLNTANLFSAWENGASGCVTWWMHGGFDALERKYWLADDGDGIPESGELSDDELMSVARHPSNAAYPAVLYANACENGWPEKLSLGREMLRSGCAAVLASSRTSWYSQGWSEPADGGNASLASYFWEAYAGRGVALGAAVSEAQVRYLKNFGSAWQHVQNAVTLMAYGDPTLSMEFRVPVAGALTGVVIAEEGIDPAGLSISLKGTDRSVSPDVSGRFSFGFVPGGAHVLEATGAELDPVEVPVTVVNGETCSSLIRVRARPSAVPGIQVPDTALAWTVQEGDSARSWLRLFNPGSGPLDLTTASDSTGFGWVSADLGRRSVAPGGSDSIAITVRTDRLFQGSYGTSIRLTTNASPDSMIRIALRLTVIDTVPPAPIDDLELAGQAGDTLALMWSAPGDNDRSGQASEYEIIAGASGGLPEDTAAVLLEKMSPAPVGKPEKAVVSLDRLIRFREPWVMIRTLDDAGLSSVSNRVRIRKTLSGEPPSRSMPEKTRLDQNYPNPFNASTAIPFTLEKASEASLSVLDAAGRAVSLLAQKRFTAGRHELFWNATDRDGRAVTSGVYLIRIQTPDHFELKKMLLLR
jgi:hypothetical protein